MMLTKSPKDELDLPMWSGLTWPSRAWFDDFFHDSDWRRPFRIEVCHEQGALKVRAELPGVDPEKDVEVEIVNDELVITAQKMESQQHKGLREYRSEFRYGSLTRSVPVPKGIDESKVTAAYKDGVLEVLVPMPADMARVPSTRRIAVKRA